MQRVVEPELMDGAAQVAAYAAADFDAPHTKIMESFLELAPHAQWQKAIDLGCGTADIALRLHQHYPAIHIDALDGSQKMLEVAAQDIARAGSAQHIRLIHDTLPSQVLGTACYDLVISNSLLHHLHEPQVLWDTIRHIAKPDAFVFIADLRRPDSTEDARQLVQQYASQEAQILQRDFYNSLCAAFTPDEITAQLTLAGLQHFEVVEMSDRHLAIYGSL